VIWRFSEGNIHKAFGVKVGSLIEFVRQLLNWTACPITPDSPCGTSSTGMDGRAPVQRRIRRGFCEHSNCVRAEAPRATGRLVCAAAVGVWRGCGGADFTPEQVQDMLAFTATLAVGKVVAKSGECSHCEERSDEAIPDRRGELLHYVRNDWRTREIASPPLRLCNTCTAHNRLRCSAGVTAARGDCFTTFAMPVWLGVIARSAATKQSPDRRARLLHCVRNDGRAL